MYRAKDGMRYTKNTVKTGRVKMGKWRTCGKRLESVVNQQRIIGSSGSFFGLGEGRRIPAYSNSANNDLHERVWLFIGLNTNSTAYGETSIANTNSCSTIIKLSQAINPSVPPYPDLFVPTTTAHFFPIWAPVYRVYFVAMAWQILLELPCSNIPRLERSVFTCAHQ